MRLNHAPLSNLELAQSMMNKIEVKDANEQRESQKDETFALDLKSANIIQLATDENQFKPSTTKFIIRKLLKTCQKENLADIPNLTLKHNQKLKRCFMWLLDMADLCTLTYYQVAEQSLFIHKPYYNQSSQHLFGNLRCGEFTTMVSLLKDSPWLVFDYNHEFKTPLHFAVLYGDLITINH
jgi:hypothetical protein